MSERLKGCLEVRCHGSKESSEWRWSCVLFTISCAVRMHRIDRFCSGRFNVDSMTFRVNYVAWPESRRTRCHRTLILLIPLDP
jgi:hypothetical protein